MVLVVCHGTFTYMELDRAMIYELSEPEQALSGEIKDRDALRQIRNIVG